MNYCVLMWAIYRRINSRCVWLIADYSAHRYLREDTACIQLLRRPAQHWAAIDKKHRGELQSRAKEVNFSQWFAVTRRWRVKRTFGVINERFSSGLILCCEGITDIFVLWESKIIGEVTAKIFEEINIEKTSCCITAYLIGFLNFLQYWVAFLSKRAWIRIRGAKN
jgi:hypothetical protein